MLENCPNITSVNFSGCNGYNLYGGKVSEGIYGMLFCECSFVFGVPVRLFWRNFSPQNLARIFSSGSQNLEKISGNFLASFELSCSFTPALPACQSYFTGDIQVLGKCTQLASVDFTDCKKITGACCSEERSFRLRPSALFGKKFLF